MRTLARLRSIRDYGHGTKAVGIRLAIDVILLDEGPKVEVDQRSPLFQQHTPTRAATIGETGRQIREHSPSPIDQMKPMLVLDLGQRTSENGLKTPRMRNPKVARLVDRFPAFVSPNWTESGAEFADVFENGLDDNRAVGPSKSPESVPLKGHKRLAAFVTHKLGNKPNVRKVLARMPQQSAPATAMH